MPLYVIMSKDRDRVYSINPCDNGPDMRLLSELGTEESDADRMNVHMLEFVLEEVWLPQLFPRWEWARVVADDFVGPEAEIVEVTFI